MHSFRFRISLLRLALCLPLSLALASASLPARAELPYEKGMKQFNQKQYGPALATFEQLLKTDPTNADAHYYVALCQHYLKNVPAARARYQQIMQQFPQSQAAQLAARALGIDKAHANATTAPGITASKTTASTSGAASPGASGHESLPASDKIFYAAARDGSIQLDALINGRSAEMTFDTTNENCIMGVNNLKEFGMTPPSGKPNAKAQGLGGSYDVWRMEIEIQVGKVRRRIPVDVKEKWDHPPLLGQAFFKGYQLDFDNARGILQLSKGGGGREVLPSGATEVSFKREGTHMLVTAKVNGAECPMYFDAGAGRCCIFYQGQVGRYGIDVNTASKMQVVGEDGKKLDGWVARVASLELGGLKEEDVFAVVLINGSGTPVLSKSTFEDCKMRIDNEKQTIRLSR